MLQRMTWLMILLSSGALLIGNVVLGAVVASSLFRALEREQAGAGFGNILSLWTEYFAWPLVIACTVALAIMFIIRLLRGQSNWFIAIGVLGTVLVASHWWSASLVTESLRVRDSMRSEAIQENSAPRPETTDSKGGNGRLAVLKEHFDYLHRTSTRAFMVETITALIITLIASGSIVFGKDGRRETVPAKPKGRADEDTFF